MRAVGSGVAAQPASRGRAANSAVSSAAAETAAGRAAVSGGSGSGGGEDGGGKGGGLGTVKCTQGCGSVGWGHTRRGTCWLGARRDDKKPKRMRRRRAPLTAARGGGTRVRARSALCLATIPRRTGRRRRQRRASAVTMAAEMRCAQYVTNDEADHDSYSVRSMPRLARLIVPARPRSLRAPRRAASYRRSPRLPCRTGLHHWWLAQSAREVSRIAEIA